MNELNEFFSILQQDLRTRSQACEFVQTSLDEITQFLDSLKIESTEVLSLALLKNLRVRKKRFLSKISNFSFLQNQLDQFDLKSKRLRTIDPYLSHCTTELMRHFESVINRFQLKRKELEVKNTSLIFYLTQTFPSDIYQ